jgi:hypothetical protein
MPRVRLITDPFDLETYSGHETDDLLTFLKEQFAEWPPTARLYRSTISIEHDVTPQTEADVEALRNAGPDDLYYVVVYPGTPIVMLVAVVAVVVLTAIALMFLMPKLPGNQNEQASANNSLGARTNQARPNARIPDIFGQVRATPDLLTVPYRVFNNHRELEIAYLCVGRGAYLVEDIRDGDTLVSNISGASLAVYGPGTSPNNPADVPQIQIGPDISDPVFNVVRMNDVNGQALKAPNDTAVRADQEISFTDGGIVTAAGGAIDFTSFFSVDDVVVIGGAADDGANTDPVPITVSAKAAAGGTLEFTGYDPSADFQVGQQVEITGATWAFSSGGASGEDVVVFDGGNASDRVISP